MVLDYRTTTVVSRRGIVTTRTSHRDIWSSSTPTIAGSSRTLFRRCLQNNAEPTSRHASCGRMESIVASGAWAFRPLTAQLPGWELHDLF
jgi:hypothetical protein